MKTFPIGLPLMIVSLKKLKEQPNLLRNPNWNVLPNEFTMFPESAGRASQSLAK